MNTKLYYLIDEQVMYRSRFISDQDIENEKKVAEECTSGEMYWVEASPEVANMPKDEVYRHE